MRQFDLSPLYRSTVGFDRLFSMLDQMNGPEAANSYPPYNIERTGENAYRISIAVAGFTDRDIAIEVKENVLAVRGEKQVRDDEIARQKFCTRALLRAPLSAASSLPTTSRSRVQASRTACSTSTSFARSLRRRSPA